MTEENRIKPGEEKETVQTVEKETIPAKKEPKRVSTEKTGEQRLADIDRKIRNIDREIKSKSKEKKQFLKKVESFKIKLESTLKKEATIENKIEETEKLEKTSSPEKKDRIEKKRWKMDAKRKKIEKTKWLIKGKIKKGEEKIKDINKKEPELLAKKDKLVKERDGILQTKKEENGKKLEENEKLKEEDTKKRNEEKEKLEKEQKEKEEQKRKLEEETKRTEELKKKREEEKRQLLLPPAVKPPDEIKIERVKELIQKPEIKIIEPERKKTPPDGLLNIIPPQAKTEKQKFIEEKKKIEVIREAERTQKQGGELKKRYEEELKRRREEKLSYLFDIAFDHYKKGDFSIAIDLLKDLLEETKKEELKKTIGFFERMRKISPLSRKAKRLLRTLREEEAKKRTEKGAEEEKLNKRKEEVAKQYEEEPIKRRQEEEIKIIKEKYIPYMPEEMIKQLGKDEEELRQRHKKELERQAEEIKKRQEEEMKKQEERWRAEQEELKKQREELTRRRKEELEHKEPERKSQEVKIIKEKYIPYIPEGISKQQGTARQFGKEEIRIAGYEEQSKRAPERSKTFREEEIVLTKEQEEKKQKELEGRRKEIEERIKKIEEEELRRQGLEKIKQEEKIRREKEEAESKGKAEKPTTEIKKNETVRYAGEEPVKEKSVNEKETKEREQKEKELLPVFNLAVNNYKKKEFDKASELFTKVKDQTMEPEKEPGVIAKLFNRLPLYIKTENYLRMIEKQKAIKEKRVVKTIKGKAEKESKEKKKEEKGHEEEGQKQPFSSRIFDFFRIKTIFYRPIIGIDISDHSIEILYLSKQRSILAYSRTTIEEGIVREGEIINQKDLTQALRLTSQRAGFQPFDPRKGALIKAIVSLPESKTYVQVFTFDSKINLLEKIKEKIVNTIPFPIDDLYWSYVESLDENSGKVKVLCAAVLKDIVNGQIHFLKASGISPIAFDIEAASIGRALIPEQESKGGTIILDIGAYTTNLNIFDKNGFISLSATIRYAGLDFAAKIADRLGVSKEKAETMMGEKGFKKEDNTLLPILEEEAEKILEEVRQSIDYYQGKSGEKIEKIILAGGSSLLPGITDFFQKHFVGIGIEIGNPLLKIKRKGGMKEERAILYSNVIGLALRSISKNPVKDGINLLPE
ncbi:MAG: pilus assembly protein PilM [Candidatus Paceibacterota bacterium]